MDEKLGKQILEQGEKGPETLERVNELFRTIIARHQQQIEELRPGSLRLLKVMLNVGWVTLDELAELHKAIEECLEDPAVPEDKKRMIRQDYDFLWPKKEETIE